MINFRIDLNRNKPQVLIWIILLSLFILVLYFRLSLQPQLVRLVDVFSKTGKVRSDLKVVLIDIAKIDQFKNDIQAYKEKVDRYEKKLPVEQEIPGLLEDLSNMAKNSNIKILGITPVPSLLKETKKEKGQIYREMPIHISAKSGYHELGSFLSDLESTDRFMKVVDIDIRANKLTAKKHDVELVVSTFILLKEK